MDTNPYQSPQATEFAVPAPPQRRGVRIAAILVLLAVILLALICLVLPASRSARPAAYRVQCSNNLKQLALALYNYADANDDQFPPAYTVDADGKPLHSWRTLLLPYLEQQALYDSIDLTKPWDHPENDQARNTIVPAFVCPATGPSSTQTGYVVVRADEGFFSGSQPFRIKDHEGRGRFGSTVLVVETSDQHRVHWMSPVDIDMGTWMNRMAAKAGPHRDGSQAVFGDRHVAYLPESLSPAALRAIATFDDADNETLGADDSF